MSEQLENESVEIIPSMDDFKDAINNSFKRISEGDFLTGTVIGITDTSVILDLGSYAEGIIPIDELSNDPRFSIKADVTVGEEIRTVVLKEDRDGNIILSRKRADDVLAWEGLKSAMKDKTVFNVKVAETVNAGVVTYLKGIRAFIPASQLALQFVDDTSSYVGKTIEACIITVDEDKQKLVLSAKEIEKDKAAKEQNNRISKLQVGLVTNGTVDKIAPYGAFVSIGNGLSGLVHISQICGKRIKSPNEVLKEGEEVTVKVIGIKDGKVSLSIKEVTEDSEIVEDVDQTPFEFTSGEEVSTGLFDLLKNIKL